jgi:NADH-quinone oxidoreductase subunit N
MTMWKLFSPEIFYFLCGLVFLGLSMTRRSNPGRDFSIALAMAALGVVVCLASVKLNGDLFYKTYQVDLFSQVFKVMLSLGLFLITCTCSELNGIEKRFHAEFYLLVFVCTLAMMLLVSAVHLLTIYIALELSSYSLYILVSLRRGKGFGLEAGLKYFLIGVFASAVMLFGVALLYSVSQAVFLTELIRVLPGIIDRPVVMVGMLLTLCGFFFKLAVFPFHFWAPDVYQGAANQATAYIATASKVAAIAILARMVALTGAGSSHLVHILVILSIISMTVGNLAAIVQKDIKRVLAYSTVAHAGYVLIGILSMNSIGYTSVVYYALALLVMKFTAFLVVIKVADDDQNLEVSQLAGLHRRSPLLAMALMIAIFSLAGIPPTIGFTAKFLVFAAAMQKGYFALVLIAMINVVISLYYYLLVLKAAYLMEPEADKPALRISAPIKILTGILVGIMVVAGIFPHYLIELAKAAVQVLI